MTSRAETDMRLAITLARRDDTATHYDIIETIKKLNRYSRSLHRLATDDCNRGLSEREQRRRQSIMTRAQEDCRSLRLISTAVEFKGDPRAGCGIVLRVRDSEFCMANEKGR